MENSQDKIKEHVKRICSPIFEKVLKEAGLDSMTTKVTRFKIIWRPNNYRRNIKVKTKTDSTIQKIESAMKVLSFNGIKPNFNLNERNRLISIKNYKGVTIQYGKDTLTAIYAQPIIAGEKQHWLIECDRFSDLDERITQKKEEITTRLHNALVDFMARFNLELPESTQTWGRYEDFIKGEKFIDSIPRECIIHDTYFKKVYEKGIEFKSSKPGEEPIAHMKQHLKNSALHDFSPEIAEELNATRQIVTDTLRINAETSKVLNQFVGTVVPLLHEYSVNMASHVRVMQQIEKGQKTLNQTLKKMNGKLSQKRLEDFK